MGEDTLSTLRFRRCDTTMILFVAKRDPSAADWSTWVETYAAAALAHAVRSLLVISEGGGPNARQRKEVVARLSEALDAEVHALRTAVCGDSAVVRAITAALAWLSGAGSQQYRSFRHEQRREALAFLGVPEPRQPEVLQIAKRLERELGQARAR